jgi:hypothetical protein
VCEQVPLVSQASTVQASPSSQLTALSMHIRVDESQLGIVQRSPSTSGQSLSFTQQPGMPVSPGHIVPEPVQRSSTSQAPPTARHTVVAGA